MAILRNIMLRTLTSLLEVPNTCRVLRHLMTMQWVLFIKFHILLNNSNDQQ